MDVHNEYKQAIERTHVPALAADILGKPRVGEVAVSRPAPQGAVS